MSLAAYNKSIELDPELADAWNGRGKVLMFLGHTNEADEAFAKANGLGYKDGQDQTEQSTIIFLDPNLEAAIRDAIHTPEGPINLSDLEGLESLDLSARHITDISPLSGLTNLQTLYLFHNQISDVSPLSGLTNLTKLNLGLNKVTDASPLSGLTNLTKLDLSSNKITDVSPLSGLSNLQTLYLFHDQISDVSPLSGLTNLTELDLGLNPQSALNLKLPIIFLLSIPTYK